MLSLSVLAWCLLAVAALLVGISKTALPGAGTISVALFAAVLPARESTGALLLLLILGDAFAVWTYRAYADWRTLRSLVPPVILGLLAGSAFLAVSGDALVRRTIAVILLLLIGLTLLRRARQGRRRRAADSAAAAAQAAGRPAPAADEGPGRWWQRAQTGGYGVLGGFTTMVANAGGPVMSMYFLASSFSINRFLGTAAWFFAAVNVTKIPFSATLGLITVETLWLDLALAPAVVVGALVGRRAARRFSQSLFDRLVIVLTIVSATYLLV